MRLIDGDKLPYIKAPIAPLLVGDKVVWCNVVYKLHIDNAPTVDAVPVVRCLDCKHTKTDGMANPAIYCKKWDRWEMPSDFYCKYGERKGGDE